MGLMNRLNTPADSVDHHGVSNAVLTEEVSCTRCAALTVTSGSLLRVPTHTFCRNKALKHCYIECHYFWDIRNDRWGVAPRGLHVTRVTGRAVVTRLVASEKFSPNPL